MHWRKWQPTPVFLPGESHGPGSLGAAVYGITQSRTRLKWLSGSSIHLNLLVCFPGGSESEESACNASNPGSIHESGRCPGEGNGYPLPVLLPGKFQGQGSLVGYNPWGCKELDVTAAAAKSLQLCPILCDPIDGSPPGSAVPGILQARTLEWVAISFSNAWKWKVKVNSFSRVRFLVTPWTAAHQAPQSMGFSRQEYWSGVP